MFKLKTIINFKNITILIVIYIVYFDLIKNLQYLKLNKSEIKLRKEEKIINSIQKDDQIFKINTSDLYDLINIFYDHRIVLLDIDLINDVKLSNEIRSVNDSQFDSVEAYEINKIDLLDSYLNVNNLNTDKIVISFGIFLESFENFYQVRNKIHFINLLLYFCYLTLKFFQYLETNLNKNCTKSNSYFTNGDKHEILTGIFIKCRPNLFIQIVLLYKRGNFYWTGSSNHIETSNQPKYFGDTPRALKQ